MENSKRKDFVFDCIIIGCECHWQDIDTFYNSRCNKKDVRKEQQQIGITILLYKSV